MTAIDLESIPVFMLPDETARQLIERLAAAERRAGNLDLRVSALADVVQRINGLAQRIERLEEGHADAPRTKTLGRDAGQRFRQHAAIHRLLRGNALLPGDVTRIRQAIKEAPRV